MSWTRVAGIGSAVVLSTAAVAGIRFWSVDLQQAFVGAALEVRQATGFEIAMAGDFALDPSWPPRAVGDNLTIANPAWTSRLPLAVVQRIEAELDPLSLFAGEVRVRRILFKGVDLRLERNRDGRTNWTFEPVEEGRALPADWTDITSSLTDLGIDGGRLAFIDSATGPELAVSIDRLITHAGNDDQPVEVEADARINAASVALAGALGSVRQIKSGLPFAIDLMAAGAGATIAVNGEMAWPVDDHAAAVALAITIEGADLRDLGSLIGTALPSVGPYDLSTRLDTDTAGFRLSALKLRLGRSDLAGEVLVGLEEGPRRLVATLTSTLIDVAELAPAGDMVTPKVDANRLPADDPSGLGMPAIAEAQIDFAGAKVVGSGFDLDQVTADIVLKDERPTLDSFDRHDGSANELGRIHGISGHVHLTAGAGSVDSDLARTVLADQATLLVANPGSNIEFNCLAGRFSLTEGAPTTAVTVVDAPAARITGVGQIDLRAQTIELRLMPSMERPDLAGRIFPVIARGPLADPEVLIDPLPAAGPADQAAASVAGPTAAGRITDAAIDNACVAQLDRTIGSDGTDGMASPIAADVSREPPASTTTQTAKKRSGSSRSNSGFFEDLSDRIDDFLDSAAKSGRSSPISKNQSRKLR